MANVVREAVEGIGISELPQNLGSYGLFTEVAIPETVKIPDAKPDIEELLSVMVDAKIVSLRIIDTPRGTSNEGQTLTGKKLSIELLLKQKVKYIADEPTQSVHAAHFEYNVTSIWVVIPEKINGIPVETLLMQGKLLATPYIEDIYGELLDKRTIFKNITVLINITSPCSPDKILKLSKASDKKYVKLGDSFTYTVVIINNGFETATNVKFLDTLPAGTSFDGSFTIDGAPSPQNPTISPGATLPDIPPSGSLVVTFKAKVNILPAPPYEITNVSKATYKYDGLTDPITSQSNPWTVNVQEPKLGLVKTAPASIQTGTQFTYTVVITNEGTLSANTINLKDTITPTNATFAYNANTLTVNGVYIPLIDPTAAAGVNIGSLDPSESITVSFDVTPTITNPANPASLSNTPSATYSYNIDPNGPSSSTTDTGTAVVTTVTP